MYNLQQTCSIQLSALPNPAIKGNIVRLSATISPSGIYDVIFKDGTNILGTVSSDINGNVEFYWLAAGTTLGLHNITSQVIAPLQCQNTVPVFINPMPTSNFGIFLIATLLGGAIVYAILNRK